MKTRVGRIVSILALVALILALATVVLGAYAKHNLARKYPAPGQLVDVGGYRMHIHCTGQGSPTVILAAGMVDFSTAWAKVQPEVARFTRVCSYDRAGYGWSETGTRPLTAGAETEELRTLLINADVAGPYVLVGHSLGGMLMRVYAREYPDGILAMVLVDSLHEERPIRIPQLRTINQDTIGQFRALRVLESIGVMALAPQAIPDMGLPAEALAQYRAVVATTAFFKNAIAELNAADESAAEVRPMNITSLGDMPLTVISAGRAQPMASLSDAENQFIWEEMQAEQTELAALSSESNQIIAEESGHYIQLAQPALVIDAIREMVEALRK